MGGLLGDAQVHLKYALDEPRGGPRVEHLGAAGVHEHSQFLQRRLDAVGQSAVRTRWEL